MRVLLALCQPRGQRAEGGVVRGPLRVLDAVACGPPAHRGRQEQALEGGRRGLVAPGYEAVFFPMGNLAQFRCEFEVVDAGLVTLFCRLGQEFFTGIQVSSDLGR